MNNSLKMVTLCGTLLLSPTLFAAPETTTDPVISTPHSSKEDDGITKHVKDKLAAEKALNTQTVIVATDNGIVMLTGELETDNQASAAITAARSVTGVNDVNTDNLKVKSSHQPFTDMVITALVKGSFLQSRLFGETNVPLMAIHVETKNGVVHLTGKAESKEQIAKAVELAKAVKNVKKVDSKVEVKKKD